ncbi:hypothetical protein NC797_07275 [Aquibacillus sp. 3ASR75-11]|uniref:Uncharacterized protein n=1 Tax=Terrihalobacillus insolitus TaxID=2950438 RepID=A0A9X3WVX0_9BACI|nr:hypothetical protein [Terrihalobacillus insolitus]MDC3424309.1 hypothetical protein [Terrihalobacillus insolitus]
MNQTLSTFLKIGVTALCIGLLLFGVAYKMTDKEAGEYEEKIDSVTTDLPTSATTTP